MNSILKACISSLVPHCQNSSGLLARNYGQVRLLFTSPILQHPTKKRRKRHPFFWLQDKHHKYYEENLTKQNEEYFQQFLKDRYFIKEGVSPLKTEPWRNEESFVPGSRRTGLLGRILGPCSMFTKEGKKTVATCVHVSDNHVIKYHPPEEYAKIGRPVCRERYKGLGCIVIGADSMDPRAFTAEYNGLFQESGIIPKKKLTRFFITHNARLEPGTPLLASHFRPGMFVDVYGKSRERGFVGLRRQFKLKLGQKSHGATKAHNRIGSIGRGRKWCGPLKGKRMQGGTFGGERRIHPGITVLSLDTKHGLLYLRAPGLPGGIGDYVNIMDSRMPKKTIDDLESPPPFPTVSSEENSKLPEKLYHSMLHLPHEPSIILEVTEEEKKAKALAARQSKAKTAQKIR